MENDLPKGKKPEGSLENISVAQGLETAPPAGEVSGHMSPGAYYQCWYDLATNYAPAGWTFFYCRICGCLNRV